MNDTLKTIAERYTCRSYTEKPVEREKLEAIALAAVQSPSAMNSQGWRIVVVNDKEFIEELDALCLEYYRSLEDQSSYERIMSRTGKTFYDAPAMMVIAVDKTGRFSPDIDLGIVTQNIALAATSLGIASCINLMAIAPFLGDKAEELSKRLQFPEGFEFGIAVLLGYATTPGAPHKPDTGKIIYL